MFANISVLVYRDGRIKGLNTLGRSSTIVYKADNKCDSDYFSLHKHLLNVSTLKGKNLLPLGANSFLLEQTLLSEGDNICHRVASPELLECTA